MNPLEFEYPVLFFSNGIGDHFINLPTIRALANLFNGKLAFICERNIANLFIQDISFHKVIYIKSVHLNESRIFDSSIVKTEIEECDLFISLVPWISVSLTELITYYSPKYTIGFFDDYKIYVQRNYSIHSSEMAFEIVKVFNDRLNIYEYAELIKMPSAAIKEAEIIKSYFPEKKVIVIHMETLSEKMWGLNEWNSFITAFLNLRDDFIAITLGYKDGLMLDFGQYADRIFPCNGLALPVSIHLLSLCDLFIGVDSSMLHAADFYCIPAIGLFGPTNYYEFGFKFNRIYDYITSNDGKMDSINYEEVLRKTLHLIREKSAI